jgi:hypothetical protein
MFYYPQLNHQPEGWNTEDLAEAIGALAADVVRADLTLKNVRFTFEYYGPWFWLRGRRRDEADYSYIIAADSPLLGKTIQKARTELQSIVRELKELEP